MARGSCSGVTRTRTTCSSSTARRSTAAHRPCASARPWFVPEPRAVFPGALFELYTAPIRGGASVKVNAALVAGGDVKLLGFSSLPSHGLTPDATRVVYLADQDQYEVFEL